MSKHGMFLGVHQVEVIAWGMSGTADTIIRAYGQIVRVNANLVREMEEGQ